MEVHAVKDVTAVIAAGGIKSRTIDPVNISKALFPVVNKPAFIYLLETLSEVGIREAFLTLGDKESESTLFPNHSNGLIIHKIVEDYPRGTAGCLKQVEGQLRGKTIVLMAAGLMFFTREDIEEILNFHRSAGADVTVGMMPVGEREIDTERVLLGANGQVEDVVHVHSSMDRRSNLKTSGIYILESRVLEHINPAGFVDMKEQLLPKLRDRGIKVIGWTHKKYRAEVRTIGDYLRMNFELLRNNDITERHLKDYREIKSQIWVGRNVRISPSATLVRPLVIGDDSRIEDDATIVGPSVIGPRCVLDKNSFVRESIFWPDSGVAPNFEVDKCLVSGRAFSLENGRCCESIVLDGKPYLDGIGAALAGTTIGKVAKGHPDGWTRIGSKTYPVLKRLIDMVFASVALVVSAPLWLLIAAAIKLDSRGPVFFVQTRCGKGAKPFRMVKFRTMVENAEELKEELAHLNESDGPMFKIPNDPRETRVGRFLRATNLDELPQFINVLRGEMSVTGPRPLSMNEMRYNPHWRDARLQVQQGVTGLWQIKGKDTNFFHDWIRYDLQYVDECSLRLDGKIILVTILKALKLM